MFNRLNSNNNIETNRNYSTKEKVASTIAAVALACGCAVGLSGCNDKNNNEAKSPEPSVSETTTTKSENDFDSEIDDAGLNFKTIHSDMLDMDIAVPEQAKMVYKESNDLLTREGKDNSEVYLWQIGDVYYQATVVRTMAEKCSSENADLYGNILTGQDSNPDNFYKLGDNFGDTALFFDSDWSAAVGKINSNGCIAYSEVRAGEKLTDLGLGGEVRFVDSSDYNTNGIDDAKRQTIRPIVRAVTKHLMQSIDATS